MSLQYIRIAANNFDATVFDTDDLATIRGASWALLEVPQHFASVLQTYLQANGYAKATVESVYDGASSGLFAVEGGGDAANILQVTRDVLNGQGDWPKDGSDRLADVLPFLTFGVACVADSGSGLVATERHLDNLVRLAQYQTLDVDIPEILSDAERMAALDIGGATANPGLPCSVDHFRPRSEYVWRSIEGKGAKRDAPVSASVFARKTHGRMGRRKAFYVDQAGLDPKDEFSLADNFEEIAAEGSCPVGVPANLFRRMAVLYMDGNAFGELRRAYIGSNAAQVAKRTKEFSDDIAGPHRKKLLGDLVKRVTATSNLLLNNPLKKTLDEAKTERQEPVLRFETLMWGADEACFVFPAWGVIPVLQSIAATLKESSDKPFKLADGTDAHFSYGVGVVLCRYKTPIRLVRQLAMDLAENAKKRTKDVADFRARQSFVDITTLAGYEVPLGSIAADRERQDNVGFSDQPVVYPLPLQNLDDIMQVLKGIRGISGNERAGIPRAILCESLDRSRNKGILGTVNPENHDSYKQLIHALDGGKYRTNSDAPINEELLNDITDLLGSTPLAFLHHVVSLWDQFDLVESP